MNMKPWREIAVPHPDVLEGTFQQSEFAADITAVRTGKATREYQEAAAFFQRTFITEGMRLLLISVARRLNGQGGDPVIQLQTAFGGGKTHTMLAVFHLATRSCPLKDLVGVPALIDESGLMNVPKANIAVLDGTNLSPGQPWKHGKQSVRTLWGELAWQLGEADGFALVKEADANGTSPGKDVLKTLLEKHSPCVVLIDELVAYIRQFGDGQTFSGGTYDTNLSFVQALTEAIKLVPNAILLASLPESEVEAGQKGVSALRALEKTFGRIQALWKPVATEEAFEIVRRRLFEPISDIKSRDTVCRAFADAYLAEGAKMPSETQEARYFNRLIQAYPIHPEVFDRLYEDWTTLEGFQRTRGVLKLMAKVIFRLWKDNNQDHMILPGSLPLYDGNSRNELVYYLQPGWDPVLEKDIDGERAETTELENKESRFGAVNAARRVARTLFLGSAPASCTPRSGARGLDRARVLLGCLQPDQPASIYSDALNRLADRLHYLNASGDKANDSTRFWFDTRANLRREMEDRKGRFGDSKEVWDKLAVVLTKLVGKPSMFDGIHVFTPHSDVPDDGGLRLVLLPPDIFYMKQDPKLTTEQVSSYVRSNGTKPRYRGNRLVFVAADMASQGRMRECTRTALAWGSIVDDVKDNRLNIDRLQEEQAKKEYKGAEEVLVRATRECYKFLLCPMLPSPAETQTAVEAFPLNTGGSTFSAEVERVCQENELVITAWSPIHLRTRLRELYWKPEKPATVAQSFWDDMQKFLFLPRLRNRAVLEQAIQKGTGSRDFFGTAYGQVGDKFEGFQFGGSGVQFDETLLLIDPDFAKTYEANLPKPADPTVTPPTPDTPIPPGQSPTTTPGVKETHPAPKAKSFHGSAEVNPATAKMRLVEIAEEIISQLASDPNATLQITLEIHADFPSGASDQVRRAVSENAKTLSFKNQSWE